jgi:hypothetical protein
MLDPHIQSTIETVVWDADSRVKDALEIIVAELALGSGR